MTALFRDLPVAWLQLSHGRMKLVAAAIGIAFADLLMWMQLGFMSAATETATYVPRQLRGELVVLNPLSEELNAAKPFSRRQLARALAHPAVAAAAPLYTGKVEWRDPRTGAKRALFTYGIVTDNPVLAAAGVLESSARLREPDTCLFDLGARPEFSEVVAKLMAGQPVAAEVNGRRIKVVGTIRIGASLMADGNLVTNDANFQRLFPQRSPGASDLGVVRLRPNADPQRVKADLQKMFGTNLLVLTLAEYVQREQDFFLRTHPITFIFSLGTAVGFLVGFAIVYQVLFTDVSNHLPQYATLKAIGYSDGYLRRIVLREAFILSVLGYIPGAVFAYGLYAVAVHATHLPLRMTLARGAMIFVLTVVMCSFSGLLAMRKLNQADPAEVF